jgi:hypothetical protein
MKDRRKSRKKPSHPPELTPQEASLLNKFVEDIKNTDPAQTLARISDARLAQIFIESLPLHDESVVPYLLALNETYSDKRVRKAIKRAVYRLRKKGVSVASLDEKGPSLSVLKPFQREEPVAYLGPVDGVGSRGVLMTVHRGAKGQETAVGVVSDEQGIQQFVFSASSKKRFREIKEYLNQIAGPLVETSLSHAATVLEIAYASHVALYPDAPKDYLGLRPWLLEAVSLRPRPMIYDLVPEPSVSDDILTDSQLEKLFAHPLMKSWIVEFEPLRPFMKDLMEVEKSPIVLTEFQQSDRIAEIMDKATREIFPAPKRAAVKNRLEEMAYVFFKLEEPEYTKICLIAAQTLGRQETRFKKNAVIEFLLERSLDFYGDATKEGAGEEAVIKKASPQIILP